MDEDDRRGANVHKLSTTLFSYAEIARLKTQRVGTLAEHECMRASCNKRCRSGLVAEQESP